MVQITIFGKCAPRTDTVLEISATGDAAEVDQVLETLRDTIRKVGESPVAKEIAALPRRQIMDLQNAGRARSRGEE